MFVLNKIYWIKILYFFILLSPIINVISEKELHEFCPHIYNEQIQNCVLPVSQYAKILHQQNGQSMTSEFNQAFSIPKVGKDVFHELCRLIRNFNSCIVKSRDECPKHITINLIDASYGYLCNEAHDIFLNSAECLMELDLQPDIKQCHDETLQEIETISTTTAITLLLKLDRMCSALNYFSSCVKIPIKEKCGNEAWHVIYHVLKHTTKTLMPGCTFNYNHHIGKHYIKKVSNHEDIDNFNQNLEKQDKELKNNNDNEDKIKKYKIDDKLISTIDYNNELFESTSSKNNLMLNCLDTNPHCERLQRACLLPTYKIKMQTECPLTCNLCTHYDKFSKDNHNVDYNSSTFQVQTSYLLTIALIFCFTNYEFLHL
ncbi:ShKT domain-containing protein [Strongyloides ratti]|uniref:ShKT domain-containing protein n=1 Tax=Strongyloides ratti TaxID=34506 RepID=A0A090MXI4_STRRB|nr:ShKT domain-containing protein [Strongyloides ratti]CEF65489.1 ShKT domain-containing protein [Strongyloides ratti]